MKLFCLIATGFAFSGAIASAEPQATVNARTLQADLLQLSAQWLAPARLHLDEQRAQLVTSRTLADDEQFIAMPLQTFGADRPSMPLRFELHSPTGAQAPVRATLSAPLEQDVLVLRQRGERGTAITCDDLDTQRKPLRFVPSRALPLPCALPADAQLRRAMLAGEVLRDSDAVPPPEVSAQAPVKVRVVVGQIALEKPGIALADAKQGERVRVRMNGSTQPLNGRVMARSLVLLEGTE